MRLHFRRDLLDFAYRTMDFEMLTIFYDSTIEESLVITLGAENINVRGLKRFTISVFIFRAHSVKSSGAKPSAAFNRNYAIHASGYLYECVYPVNGISRSV